MNKGFTLIELLAVIIVLSLISTLAVPTVINQLAKNKEKTSGVMSEIMNSAVELYLDYHQDKYSMTNGDLYCVKIENLINEGFLVEPVLDPISGDSYSKNSFIKINVGENSDLLSTVTEECTEIIQ